MPNTLAHGWIVLLFGYGLTVAGLLVGLRLAHALAGRASWAFGIGLPVFFAGIVLWNVVVNIIAPGLFHLLPGIFGALLAATFYAAFGILVAMALCGGKKS
jgi:hypothetical protein